ncbi:MULTISPECIES: molybdopterin-dependent oxidoreductase [Haloferax]|uniref:Molybdopterin-dependent oxidoreductase n=2 Tax=Haloferax TaxID=2251 RepID=A0A6G1Z6V3_9EURY|nr:MULTISPECIES: molybdopterin-dependent oxidoreductase [Haloferax]KAB1185481.1 molybdopterin-dependent oxidoreductase [Haloferax sp. CBA1149]MRW82131.1 molybdopterin-dependent oxidoreductase [Haloferax marinisediminis]
MTTPILVRGHEAVPIDREVLADLPRETEKIAISCASGLRHESKWSGFPLGAVLEFADAPPETTHIAVTSADDCHVYVAIRDALSGLLAVEQDGKPLEAPRLVVPDIDGMRSVKDVVAIEAVSLDSGTDPTALERHPKVEDTDS